MRALLVWSLALCGVLLCLAHVAEAQAFAVCTGKAIPEGEKHQIAIDVERSPLLARHKRAIEKMVKVSVDVSSPSNAEVMQAKEIALELNDVIPQLTKDTILILEAFVHCTAGVPYWQIHVFPLQQMLWNHYMWSNAVARKKADPTAPAPEASLHPAIPHVPADATRVEYVFAQFLLYANSRALAPLFKNVRVDATEDLSPFFKPIVIERMLEHRPQILSQMLTEGIMTSFCMYGTPEPLRKYALDFFFSEAIKGDAALDVLPSIAAAILEDSIHQIDASLDLTKAGTGAVTAEQLDNVIEKFPEGSEGNPARTPFIRMLKVYKQPENLARLKAKVVDMVAHGGARPPPSIMRRVADSLANFLGWRSDPPVAPVLETARTWVTMCPDNQPCAQHVGWVSPSEAIKIIAGPQLKRRFESFERARSLSPKGSHPSSPQHADPLPGPKTPPSSPPPSTALPSLSPSGPARKQPQHFTFNVPPRTASLASTLVPGPRTPPSDK